MGGHFDPTPTFPAGIARLDAEASGHGSDGGPGEIIILTGMSGAGKTLAAGVLQDKGWYVVDNLPPRLIAPLAGMMTPGSTVQHLAIVVDVRSWQFFETLTAALDQLKASGQRYRVIFLDASDQALIQRYERVRRPHPLQEEGTILEGLARERDMVAAVRLRSDAVLDTTDLSINDFARAIDGITGGDSGGLLTVSLLSFGFKFGLPLDANHVADVRFLNNPYWIDELRHLTGLDEAVRRYVLGLPDAPVFMDRYVSTLRLALAGYLRERKLHVTVAVGCTGGKHRSVVIVEALAEALRSDAAVRVLHRDLGRE